MVLKASSLNHEEWDILEFALDHLKDEYDKTEWMWQFAPDSTGDHIDQLCEKVKAIRKKQHMY